MATSENPLFEAIPTFLYLRAFARPAAGDLVTYLKNAPRDTTLVRFGDSMTSSNDRIWLPGQYARYSILEADLTKIFFGEESQAAQKLRTLLEKWFDIRHYPSNLWKSIPEISRLPALSHIHTDSRQTFGVFSVKLNRGRTVELRVVGAEEGSTKAANLDVALTASQAQQLVDIIYAGGSIELVGGSCSLRCRCSAATTYIEMWHERRPGRKHVVQLTEFQRYALRNRIMAILSKSH